jgi:DNA gyrase inhibitor GyrI
LVHVFYSLQAVRGANTLTATPTPTRSSNPELANDKNPNRTQEEPAAKHVEPFRTDNQSLKQEVTDALNGWAAAARNHDLDQHMTYDSYSSFSRIKDAYYRLITWYRQRGGSLDNVLLYGMSQDNPDVTPLQLCRFDWCVKVPVDWKGDGDVGVMNFPACRVAAIRCVGDLSHENKVIQYLFRYWLPRSRFQPANLPGMEIYRRQPAEMGWEEYDIDCAVPVVPL